MWINRETFALVRLKAVQTNSGRACCLQRGDAHLFYGGVHRDGRPIRAVDRTSGASDCDDRRAKSPAGEARGSLDKFYVNVGDFSPGCAAGGARQRPHHVSRDRSRPAVLRQGRRHPRRVSSCGTSHAMAMAKGVMISIRPTASRCPGRHSVSRLRGRRPDPTRSSLLLFAGVLAAGNLQRPKIGHTPLRRQRGLSPLRRRPEIGCSTTARNAIFESLC